ncbi:unnamed protein product [Rotaria sordida]|uniref:Uncharacterized protein n=1 Tax=Rotaria sordida TaxID=392033 RepID=A0A815UNE1_9BILA|nr:unnamed protein product [Rotaria sordida]CAF1518446.1 unnamed protein product [Rotaria sordida]CAF3803741.1 unnamed protein product [Rotaria sordida]CAF4099469.1 unnamed protein product [Rotaria sordida]
MTSQDIMMTDETSSLSSSSIESSSSSFSSYSTESSLSSSSCSTECSSSSLCSAKSVITKTTSNKRILISCGVLLHAPRDDEFLCYSGKVTDHSHLPNPAELEVRNLREKMRQRAESEILPLQIIAEHEMRNALLTVEALAVLPGVTNIDIVLIFLYNVNILVYFLFMFVLGHNLVHNRRKMIPPIPQSCSFLIPDLHTTDYHNKERDIRFAGRLLIWSTDVQLNLLFDSQRLHMDGTFCTAPPNFDQMFIIQAISHGTCVYKNVQSRGLSLTYLDNIMIRSVIRQMMALALVPEQYIPSLFANLGQELNGSECNELSDLFKYFNDHWM